MKLIDRTRSASFDLFHFRGIRIQVHATFPLILIWAVIQYGILSPVGWVSGVYGVYATVVLFILVLFHEIGHAMAALHYGAKVHKIVLFPLGGVALMDRLPRGPKAEFLIAIMGPAVNLIVFIFMTITARLGGYSLSASEFSQMLVGLQRWSPAGLFYYIYVSNIILGGFNLIPAMPLDGGRILRSVLSRWIPSRLADQVVLIFGLLVAAGMIVSGLMIGDWILLIMAVVVLSGVGLEYRAVRLQNRLEGLQVGQVMTRPVEVIAPQTRLEVVVDKILNSPHTAFAVVDANHEYLGLVTLSSVARAMREGNRLSPASEYMLKDIYQLSHREDLLQAYYRLVESGHSVLPVVEDGRVLGMLSYSQIRKVMQFGLLEE